MKIAYFGFNAMASCLDVFIQRQYEVAAIFTGDDSVNADRLVNYAMQQSIPCYLGRPTQEQMQALVELGVELFFAAEYPWKIPIPADLPFALNLHPTMLPEGRGCTPLPLLLQRYPDCAGVTLHKMVDTLDTGDIVLQKKIHVEDNDTFDTLLAKNYLEAPLLLERLLVDLQNLYDTALPQQLGSYWPKLTAADQRVDWRQSTAAVLKHQRSFGSLGIYAAIQGNECLITAAQGVEYAHAFNAGDIILLDKVRLLIATLDGFITVDRSHLFELE